MRKSILKTGTTEVNTIIDKETGEIIETSIKRHTYIADNKEIFFIGYSSLIGAFMEMSQAEIRIFGYCLRFAKGVHFDISKKIRLDISAFTGLNERTVLNTLPVLLEKGILYKHSSGLYQLNPRYAFEGSTAERSNQLKILIELGCKDC
jgi:hypothetical protein